MHLDPFFVVIQMVFSLFFLLLEEGGKKVVEQVKDLRGDGEKNMFFEVV